LQDTTSDNAYALQYGSYNSTVALEDGIIVLGDIPANTASLCIVDSSFENVVVDGNVDSLVELAAIGTSDEDVTIGVVNTCFEGLSSPNPVNPIVPISYVTSVADLVDSSPSGKGSGKGGKGGGGMSMMQKYLGKQMMKLSSSVFVCTCASQSRKLSRTPMH
jgi:hypothetical protein